MSEKTETLTIELTNSEAYKLLKEMEKLNLIKVLKTPPADTLSSLRGKIKTPMNHAQIDDQLKTVRKEWQRDI